MGLFTRCIGVLLVFLVGLFLMNLPATLGFAADSGVVGSEVNDVSVYVICLEGVSARGVSDMSSVFEGIVFTSRVGGVHYWTGELEYEGMTPRLVMDEISINVSVTLIADWTAYKLLVEYANNAIIINAHGETLPIPNGYDKEEFVDKIAEAMLHRNVTWVHVTGYPFSYYWQQKTGEEACGEEGFKRLMSHIGKNNVTCWPPDYLGVETGKIDLSPEAKQSISLDWPMLERAFFITMGYPLKGADFKDLKVQPNLYGGGDRYYPANAVRFAQGNETHNFGFYIHFGAGQTYDSNETETDRDFYGAYAAVAVAIRANIMKAATLDTIQHCEAAVTKAHIEGRTKGLDEADNMLKEAAEAYFSNSYDEAIIKAIRAKRAAEEAVNPSLLESYGLFIGALGIVGTVMGVLTIRWRNNRRKNSRLECRENEKT